MIWRYKPPAMKPQWQVEKSHGTILHVVEDVCGSTVVGQNDKQRRTNDGFKKKSQGVKESLEKLRTKMNEERWIYIEKQNKAKLVLKQAKQQTWKN